MHLGNWELCINNYIKVSANNRIQHKGIIKSIEKKMLKVSIISQSACADCHAKGVCNVSDMEEKIIDIKEYEGSYKLGENVNLFYEEKQGFKALFLGYVLPFLLILATLILTSVLTKNELIIGLASISILVPYYVLLFLSKKKIEKKFIFKVEKL